MQNNNKKEIVLPSKSKTIFGDMIREISSKSNDFIKDLLKSKHKKNRSDEFLIEGERFVFEAIKRKIPIKTILFVAKPEFVNEAEFDCVLISSEIAEALSSTVSPSGVFAVVKYGCCDFQLPNGDFLVLDGVSDPGNLGTIIRSALAFGFRQIYMLNCVDWRNDKVLRSTMGTIFDVELYKVSFDDVVRLNQEFALFKAEMIGQNVFEFNRPSQILGLVLGNEANGISSQIDDLVSAKLSIPMRNNVESLNVAVAGAILMSKLSNY